MNAEDQHPIDLFHELLEELERGEPRQDVLTRADAESSDEFDEMLALVDALENQQGEREVFEPRLPAPSAGHFLDRAPESRYVRSRIGLRNRCEVARRTFEVLHYHGVEELEQIVAQFRVEMPDHPQIEEADADPR